MMNSMEPLEWSRELKIVKWIRNLGNTTCCRQYICYKEAGLVVDHSQHQIHHCIPHKHLPSQPSHLFPKCNPSRSSLLPPSPRRPTRSPPRACRLAPFNLAVSLTMTLSGPLERQSRAGLSETRLGSLSRSFTLPTAASLILL